MAIDAGNVIFRTELPPPGNTWDLAEEIFEETGERVRIEAPKDQPVRILAFVTANRAEEVRANIQRVLEDKELPILA